MSEYKILYYTVDIYILHNAPVWSDGLYYIPVIQPTSNLLVDGASLIGWSNQQTGARVNNALAACGGIKFIIDCRDNIG